jgi:hypothetical protein
MKRLWLMALLLSGCGQAPAVTAPPIAAMAIAPVPDAASHVAAAPAPALKVDGAPKSGLWELAYTFGRGPERTQQLHLTFDADHGVTVSDLFPGTGEYPFRWDAQHVTFEGLPRRDMAGGPGIGRDRLDLAVVSSTEMRGTLSFRVNLRWLAIPVTARLVSQSAELKVQPGTIVDTDAPERID